MGTESTGSNLEISGAIVQKLAGISRNALVNYERHGAVRPARGDNGYRQYSHDDLLDVMCCTMLTSMGYSVTEAALLLQEDEIMSVDHIDAYLERLARQRDAVEAKMENLEALRRATVSALPPEEAVFSLVECPDWLFFFDEHESVNIRDVQTDNQTVLLRSVPLSCRGFTVERFFDTGDAPLAYRWARTLRASHAGLLDVDASRACVLGGACVHTIVQASYPDLDLHGILAARLAGYLREEHLRVMGDPFVPLLLNNRRPSPVFELFIPVEPAREETGF